VTTIVPLEDGRRKPSHRYVKSVKAYRRGPVGLYLVHPAIPASRYVEMYRLGIIGPSSTEPFTVECNAWSAINSTLATTAAGFGSLAPSTVTSCFPVVVSSCTTEKRVRRWPASRRVSPTLVCSVFADQPFWGRRLASLGVGAHVPFSELTQSRLEESLRPLLGRAWRPGLRHWPTPRAAIRTLPGAEPTWGRRWPPHDLRCSGRPTRLAGLFPEQGLEYHRADWSEEGGIHVYEPHHTGRFTSSAQFSR
jgi:hypothetical protein